MTRYLFIKLINNSISNINIDFHICYYILTHLPCLTFSSAHQQDQLVQSGVIPRLVSIMKEYPDNDPLVNVCLLALCNLADMGDYLPLFFTYVLSTYMKAPQ